MQFLCSSGWLEGSEEDSPVVSMACRDCEILRRTCEILRGPQEISGENDDVSFVENQGAKIYWDEQGPGEPILLVMGLGYPSDAWWRTRPMLARTFRTIAFDNRGVGRSDVPPGPYPIALMASDALSVLDAAGVASAHVYGVSMGGMIAQELTLQHPERVRSLILGCTAAGGPTAVQADPEVRKVLMTRGSMSPEEAAEVGIPFIYDSGTPRARIDEDLEVRRPWFPRGEAYNAQLQGILAWEAYSRLPQIAKPTLVIHGETDRLVPPANGKLIADRIPGAKLVLLPHASHLFATDQPDASMRAILDFLASAGRPGQPA
jgi:pimeloyl-ACP methyl ester carboxylesterase